MNILYCEYVNFSLLKHSYYPAMHHDVSPRMLLQTFWPQIFTNAVSLTHIYKEYFSSSGSLQILTSEGILSFKEKVMIEVFWIGICRQL